MIYNVFLPLFKIFLKQKPVKDMTHLSTNVFKKITLDGFVSGENSDD
jgi:hypothetical protein